MRPNLKAFLSTARGIPDYILEDYNNNFGLDIPLTDDSGQLQNILNPVTFRKEAKSKNNQEALKFIDFLVMNSKTLRMNL
jgi:ABC-type tungstate transport system permease subunit